MKKLSTTATIPLWDLWNREKLEIKKEEVGPTVWARGWQMNPQAKTVNQIYYNFSYLNLTSPVECRKEGEIEEAKSVELDTNLPVIISPDFNIGEVDMMCWNILQVRDGIIRVIDEIPLNQVSVYNAMLAFVDRIEASSKHIIVYGDPSGWSKQPNEGRCCFDVIQEVLQRRAQSFELKIVKSWVGATVGHGEGKYINPKPPHRLARHEAVNAKLKNPWTKQPELFINADTCPILQSAFLMAEYTPGTQRTSDNEPRIGHATAGLGSFISKEFSIEKEDSKPDEPRHLTMDDQIWLEVAQAKAEKKGMNWE